MAYATPRIDITESQIDSLMTRFYQRIRAHAVLSPIFMSRIKDWPSHEAKIGSFWKKAILQIPGYDGNPMSVHMDISAMKPEHFDIWLDLFEETATEVLPAQPAADFSALARRIGQGFKIRLQGRDMSQSAAPVA